MATLSELARQHTSLSKEDIGHLQRLVGEWGMLADFCFADLLLYVPAPDGRWLVLGQVRPVTSQTIYQSDWVGSWANDTERPLLTQAWSDGDLVEGEVSVEGLPERTRMLVIPVRHDGRVVALLTREWSPAVGRQPGELERTYLAIFQRFAEMIAAGTFPFATERTTTSASPRVGDGVIVLDADATASYASPNAVSALHRVGISANAVGLRLAELGFYDGPVRAAFEGMEPVAEEFEQTPEITLLTRCIPLVEGAGDGRRVTGGVLLIRDVSELRRRDRMLLSKDATIREIHHRVKNNLQTISSLLRLQGRRLESPEAKAAIAESVRRIRTIALVHETLSREASDDVAFIEIVRPLTRMAEESLQSPDRPVRFRVVGDGGKLPATIATPLAVVLTELLQNAVDHAFREGREGAGSVVVMLANDGEWLDVTVLDDGRGLPRDFALEQATGLGLSIVRTLVTTELAGTIEMRAGTADELAEAGVDEAPGGGGTVVALRVPVQPQGR
ncbi:MAG TPA: sensor histidine kinase [Acidimicrobiales bacterium]